MPCARITSRPRRPKLLRGMCWTGHCDFTTPSALPVPVVRVAARLRGMCCASTASFKSRWWKQTSKTTGQQLRHARQACRSHFRRFHPQWVISAMLPCVSGYGTASSCTTWRTRAERACERARELQPKSGLSADVLPSTSNHVCLLESHRESGTLISCQPQKKLVACSDTAIRGCQVVFPM